MKVAKKYSYLRMSSPSSTRSICRNSALLATLIPFAGAFLVDYGGALHHHRCRRRLGQHSSPLHAPQLMSPSLQSVSLLALTVHRQQQQQQHQHEHALAILTMPETSLDRIANEAIIEAILPETRKLSVVLRCQGGLVPSTAALRRYVGEIYSQLWDVALGADTNNATPNPDLPNVIVYPQNLPNAAPESWLDIQPDLDCICSHDATIGWTSTSAFGASSTAKRFQLINGNGRGGLNEHVANVNRERALRQLQPVRARPVNVMQQALNETQSSPVIFLEDEEFEEAEVSSTSSSTSSLNQPFDRGTGNRNSWLAGASPIRHVYDSVCVGGTFDGLHFGHRKLLTLAVSSVTPVVGRLLVGVTVDEMLRQKAFCDYIPSFDERVEGVTRFLHSLAPGMMNRIQVVPISDNFGPPGEASPRNRFDAIVLSHETLHTGVLLNQYRVEQLVLPPLQLLCTRRTEAHGMSSTALRRIRQQRQEQQRQQ